MNERRAKEVYRKKRIKDGLEIAFTLFIFFNNMLSILIFMIEEYIPPRTIAIIDLLISTVFIVELFHTFKNASPPRTSLFTKFDTWIDIITIMTPMVEVILEFSRNEEDQDLGLKVFRVFRIFKVFRVLRIQKLIKKRTVTNAQDYDDESRRKLTLIMSPIKQ